jgi:uncharacterized iron-regulated membrane protein
MRPVRIITAVVFAAAVAVTGCAANSTATDPSAVPAAPVAAAPGSPAVKLATPDAKQPVTSPRQPAPISEPAPAPKPPVLADGRHNAYIREVNSRGDYVVVDLVQVFHDKAAVEAAIADGQSRDNAQYLYTYVRNENSRLRTLRLADDLRLHLLGGDCEAPISSKLNTLAAHVRSDVDHSFYYRLTVDGGAVHRIQEIRTANAC